jgi:T-complex protein 1 subunit zeta
MVTVVNSKADVLKATQALAVNCNAAKSLQEIMKTNLGPRGTLKMLVGGAGQIKITKDGKALLDEMQIQHPTACMIARAATAQDDMTGDGTTTNVLFIGELMKHAEQYLGEGLHPRMVVEGFDLARAETLKFLETFKAAEGKIDREILISLALTSLRTKLPGKMAEKLADICCDAVLLLKKEDEPETLVDLHMIEIMAMKHKLANETRLVKGLVLDHGSRHPDMPKKLNNCYILTANVSLEYEKTEVNSGFYYNSADQRDKLVASERYYTDEKVRQVLELKRKVCTPENGKTFVLINQKGIDPPSLEMLAKEGIIALRRAKRRNMERLVLACGGNAVNSFDDLDISDLGEADTVYEHVIEDDKFTFVEGLKNPNSCTVLITGPNDHTIHQIKDSLRDGLKSVLNAIEDDALIPGAGAFELGAFCHLEEFKKSVEGKARLGVEAFAKAMLVVPKTLIENSGMDVQENVLKLLTAYEKSQKSGDNKPVGIDLVSGEVMNPVVEGIYDNYRVKKQLFNLAPVLAQQLLLVDEIIRAGVQMNKKRD